MPATTQNGIPNLVSIPKGYAPLNEDGMALANLAAWHMQLIGNSGMLAALPEPGSSAPMGTASNPMGIFQRPWLSEPPGSIPFDEQDAIPVSPGALDAPVLTMRVPQGYDGVINWIANNIQDSNPFFMDFSGALIWKILINGKPIRNFGNIMAQKGTVAQGREESPIRIFSGDVIQYTISSTNVSGIAVCSLTGYFYPSKGVS